MTMHTTTPINRPEREVRLAEVDEVVPAPVSQDILQVSHGGEDHLQEGSPAPNGSHAPGGEVDIRIVRQCFI